MELGVYVHIPFCIKKCDYCDFISYPNKFEVQKEYVERLLEEIQENEEILKKNQITTIYIGGGTPSSIEPKLIERILNKIYEVANMKNLKDLEITIEVNPGASNKNNLQLYKKCGINRLSIGLQSTNNELLREIGRIHTYEQFLETYNLAVEEEFKSINIDLMLGLPNQTISDLKSTLEDIINLKPEAPKHISVYSLIVEEGTLLEKKISKGELNLPDEEEERNQYHYAKKFLEVKGYKHYEISNFAKSGYESKHNMNCWEQKQYIGFGLAAHSYINGCRYSNTCNLEEYLSYSNNSSSNMSSLDNKVNNKKNCIKIVHEKQNLYDMEKEYMLLGLRKIEGIDIQKFKEKFRENPIYLFRNEIKKLTEEELIEVDLDNIRLTNKGLDLANLVWEEFI